MLTGTLKRSVKTAKNINLNIRVKSLKILDDLDYGIFDGESIKEFKKTSKEFERKEFIKYRIPKGESYMDIIQRIDPIIYEIEKSKYPIIVV